MDVNNRRRRPREILKDALYEDGTDIFFREAGAPSRSMVLLGRAFSGKTTFLVANLNKLVNMKRGGTGEDRRRPMYDLIVLFTESMSAAPLEGLNKKLKVLVVPSYVPEVVKLLKRINDAAINSFRFLVILDDVVSGIRAGTFAKQILTMRNSHISTAILIQYVKLLSPSIRNSLTHYYITKLKPEEWEYLMSSFLRSLAVELIGQQRTISELSSEWYKWVMDDIVHYNQPFDEVTFIQRDLGRS